MIRDTLQLKRHSLFWANTNQIIFINERVYLSVCRGVGNSYVWILNSNSTHSTGALVCTSGRLRELISLDIRNPLTLSDAPERSEEIIIYENVSLRLCLSLEILSRQVVIESDYRVCFRHDN